MKISFVLMQMMNFMHLFIISMKKIMKKMIKKRMKIKSWMRLVVYWKDCSKSPVNSLKSRPLNSVARSLLQNEKAGFYYNVYQKILWN